MGLTYDRTMFSPFGFLCDLIAIDQIQNGFVDEKIIKTEAEEREEFFRLMSFA